MKYRSGIPGLLFCLTFLSISQSHADVDKGKEAYFMGDYEIAYNEFLIDANKANSYAQIKLGFMLENGWGTDKNYSKAKEWYDKAADLNDPEAHIALGKLYAYGKGLTKNPEIAKAHFLTAAELGYYHAYYILGDIHNDIFAFGNNDKEALKWYLLAAERNAAAFLRNGHYSKGRGQWFRLLTPAGVILTKKAADDGNQFAQFNVALRYYFGEGTAIDHVKAHKYFHMAALAGNVEAQNYLAQSLVVKNPDSFDKIEADMWFSIAANNGSTDAAISKQKMEAGMTPEEISSAESLATEWMANH